MRLLRLLILLPLVLPPWLVALRCSNAFGRLGLIGRCLQASDISIAFNKTAVVMAHTFISLSFLGISHGDVARIVGAAYEYECGRL